MRHLFARLSSAAGLYLMAATAQADPAPVQSGEHAAFTRLVMPLNGATWAITQTGREVALKFENYDSGFDTGRIFDRIPRDRIAEVAADADQLTLTLNCDCAVAAFVERGAFVVVDVANAASDLQTSALTPTALAQSPTPQRPPNRPSPAPAPGLDFDAVTPLTPQAKATLQEVDNRLSAELRTAKDRGLLEAAPTAPRAPRPQIDTRVFYDTPPAETPLQPRPLPAEVPPGTNLRITTSRDLPGTFRDLAEIVGNAGQNCPADDTLALGDWGNTDSFAQQIAAARQGLYGEFDRIDPDVALRLARSYLYFGFGAEARDVLRLAETLPKAADTLWMMADVLDGLPVAPAHAPSDLRGCSGEAALWAVLTLPDPPQGALPNVQTALRNLNSKPAHLRTILAPRVSEILRRYGDPESAQTALRSLDRLPDTLPTSAKLAQANAALSEGQADKGTEKLTRIAKSNAPESPEALIALVDAHVAAETPISPEVAGLVAAYAQELRDGDLGPALRRAELLTLVDAGAFDTVFARPLADDALRAHILRQLTARADDVHFLEHSFAQPGAALALLPPEDLIDLAARQLALGFAAQAEITLGFQDPTPLRTDRQILSARIALAMNKPFKATAELLDVTDPAADPLRAEAKKMAGAHDEAHQLYSQLGQPDRAAEAAFLSDNWQSLTAADTPVYGPLTQLAASAEQPETGKDGMLARSTALLGQSAEARAALQDLLTAEDLSLPTPEG